MSSSIVVKPGTKVKLADLDPALTRGLDKQEAAARLAADRERIAELQEKLYAENQRALLVILQGTDTSGKDGTIKAVLTGVDPLGLEVTSFGKPSYEELEHDFLWRIHARLPRKGNIGVFNRSHYEDVLVARVRKLVEPRVWKARYAQINAFEALISELGYTVLKFFLHISRAEQKERLLKRLAEPHKRHKFQLGDLEDRAHWDDYQEAYEDALEKCSTDAAPWHIVPADKKWYRNALVARTVAETLEAMRPTVPSTSIDPASVTIPD
jgi:PPK2 family polyphosphate:nucleotide phosphotransferase